MKSPDKIEQKREKEMNMISCMIQVYCKGNHGKGTSLCMECEELRQYANKRISGCPVMENKTFCSNCKIHCYQPAMRMKIKEVMRFSGPRMLMVHPFMALRHVLLTVKSKYNKGAVNDK